MVCSHNGTTVHEEETETNTLVISNLSPGRTYSFYIAMVLKNGSRSETAVLHTRTRKHLYALQIVIFNGNCFFPKPLIRVVEMFSFIFVLNSKQS